jgi:hypothetical protein
MLNRFIDPIRTVDGYRIYREKLIAKGSLSRSRFEPDAVIEEETKAQYDAKMRQWMTYNDNSLLLGVDEKFHELFLNKHFVVVSESAYQLLSKTKSDGVKSQITLDIYDNQFNKEISQFARFEAGMRNLCQIYIPVAGYQKDNVALKNLAKIQISDECDEFYSEFSCDGSIYCAVSKKIIKPGQSAVMIPFITNKIYTSDSPLNQPYTSSTNTINRTILGPIYGEYVGGEKVFIPNLALGGDDHLHAIQGAFNNMPYAKLIHGIIHNNLTLPGGVQIGCMIVHNEVYFDMINQWELDEVDSISLLTSKCLFDENDARSVYNHYNFETKNDFMIDHTAVHSWENPGEFYDLFVHKGLSMLPVGQKMDIPFLCHLQRVTSYADYILSRIYLTNKGAINWDLAVNLAEMIRFDEVLSQLNQMYMPNIFGVADQDLVKKVAKLVLSRTKNKYL